MSKKGVRTIKRHIAKMLTFIMWEVIIVGIGRWWTKND